MKIACKICPKCGTYNDISNQTCSCGCNLTNTPGRILDELPETAESAIVKREKVYVQKCPSCSALNVTDSESHRLRFCYNCHRPRIANQKVYLYSLNESEEEEEIEQKSDSKDDKNFELSKTKKNIDQLLAFPEEKQDLENEEDIETDWSDDSEIKEILDSLTHQETGISMSAVHHGPFSFNIKASETPYLLGRFAGQADFLEKDLGVSNEHCYIIYENNNWYVRDYPSLNGTYVDNIKVKSSEGFRLRNGCHLRLGRRSDSLEFIISIPEE